MSSLETIGNAVRSGAPRTEVLPVARAAAGKQLADGSEQKPADKPLTARRVDLPARAFQARLNYDESNSEVVIEILDPQTGDVLQRIPPEEVPHELRPALLEAGPFVRAVA